MEKPLTICMQRLLRSQPGVRVGQANPMRILSAPRHQEGQLRGELLGENYDRHLLRRMQTQDQKRSPQRAKGKRSHPMRNLRRDVPPQAHRRPVLLQPVQAAGIQR